MRTETDLSGWNCAMSRDCVATGEGGSVDVATAPLPPAAAPPPPDRLRRTFMLKLPIYSAGNVDLINTHHGSGWVHPPLCKLPFIAL